MSDANDVVINTNANAVTLKKGTGDNTLLKLSNTSTSLGNGAFSVGLNTISIGCNADTADAVPFEQDMEITDGKLTINTIRQSGVGDYCLMYDPTSVPKELTYSRYIPDHFDQIDVSMNIHDVSLNVHDVSLNIHDVSLNGLDISVNIIDVSLNIHDVSLNGLDISVNIIDVSLNIHDVSLNGLDISVNIIDVSLNIHDVSLNVLDVSLNILDTSVNIIDVSLNDHNNRLNNNNISLNVLDTSVNIIDVSLNELIDQGGVSYGATFAIGAGSSATGTNSFAIGNNATIPDHDNAVAIGNGSTVGASNVISLGDGTQKVGIGTTTPESALDMDGNLMVRNGLIGLGVVPSASDMNTPANYVHREGSIFLGNHNTPAYPNKQYVGKYDKDWNSILAGMEIENLNTGAQKLHFWTHTPGTYLWKGLTIAENGNVGIGTSSPGQKLSIQDGNLGVFNSTNDIMALFAGSYGGYLHIGCWNQAGTTSKNIVLNQYGGRVGIGTTSPSFPLDIVGSVGANVTGRFFNANANLTYGTNTGHGIGIRTTGGVYTSTGSIISSDRRIKTNITEINDASSLDKIRLLKPCYYNYIDTTDRTSSVVEGFIANEVKEVLPYAVSLQTSYIPNIFKVGSYNSLDNIITIDDYDTNTLEYDASNNVFKKIKLYDISDNKYECEINEIIASNQIKIQPSEDIPTDIFVYGQEVDNFNVLKKDSIFTVATAALQEVDRQLQAEKTKVAELETKNAALETQMASVLARLDTLENP